MFSWIMGQLAKKKLYDEEGHSLKIYHFIYSRKHNNLRRLRRECRTDLDKAGLFAGYLISHPYRGKHGKNDSPSDIRSKLDRKSLSLHIHGFALGYWSDPVGDKDVYYNSKVLADIRSWSDRDKQIFSRGRILAQAQYDLGHAGWYGNGQCVTRYGKGTVDSYLIPDQPLVHVRYPIADEDGTYWWELRQKPGDLEWDEFRQLINNAVQCDAQRLDSKSYINDLPKDGAFNGMTRYWSLDQVKTDEYHGNWMDWRTAVANSVKELMTPGSFSSQTDKNRLANDKGPPDKIHDEHI